MSAQSEEGLREGDRLSAWNAGSRLVLDWPIWRDSLEGSAEFIAPARVDA